MVLCLRFSELTGFNVVSQLYINIRLSIQHLLYWWGLKSRFNPPIIIPHIKLIPYQVTSYCYRSNQSGGSHEIVNVNHFDPTVDRITDLPHSERTRCH